MQHPFSLRAKSSHKSRFAQLVLWANKQAFSYKLFIVPHKDRARIWCHVLAWLYEIYWTRVAKWFTAEKKPQKKTIFALKMHTFSIVRPKTSASTRQSRHIHFRSSNYHSIKNPRSISQHAYKNQIRCIRRAGGAKTIRIFCHEHQNLVYLLK